MLGEIVGIEAMDRWVAPGRFVKDDEWCGYRITLDDEETPIEIGIDNRPQCCEGWGYLASEDDVQAFVGAELLSIKATDTARRKYEADVDSGEHADLMFVDLETSRGVLQLAVYTAHNGYYGHDVRFVVPLSIAEKMAKR